MPYLRILLEPVENSKTYCKLWRILVYLKRKFAFESMHFCDSALTAEYCCSESGVERRELKDLSYTLADFGIFREITCNWIKAFLRFSKFTIFVMGRTLTSNESKSAASEKCFILTEPPSVYRISIRLLTWKLVKAEMQPIKISHYHTIYSNRNVLNSNTRGVYTDKSKRHKYPKRNKTTFDYIRFGI